MNILKWTVAVVLVILIVLAIVAPVGPLPGFFIGGTATPTPENWGDTSSTHEIKLKVPGTVPRVVIIWVVQYNNALHVVGASDGGWVRMLGQGGPVEMRLGDNTYALNAVRITDDLEGVLDAYVSKYRPDYPDIVADFPSIEDAEGQYAVFRLEPSR